jgi:hypothetical protein
MNKASNDEGRIRVAQRRADPWETLAEAHLTGDARAARRAFAQLRTRLRARWLFAFDTAMVTLAARSEAMAATEAQRAELGEYAQDGAR